MGELAFLFPGQGAQTVGMLLGARCALGGGKIGIDASEIVGRQFVIRGVVFVRWFSELSQDEQLNDIEAAIKLAGELPFLFKVGAVYGLADFQQAISAVEAPNRDGFVFSKP